MFHRRRDRTWMLSLGKGLPSNAVVSWVDGGDFHLDYTKREKEFGGKESSVLDRCEMPAGHPWVVIWRPVGFMNLEPRRRPELPVWFGNDWFMRFRVDRGLSRIVANTHSLGAAEKRRLETAQDRGGENLDRCKARDSVLGEREPVKCFGGYKTL